MPKRAPPAGAPASDDPRPDGPRLSRSRSLVVIFAVLLAAMVGVRWWTVTHADRDPGCVWATPTGRMTFGPVAEFGDVRDAPGGRSLEGDWETIAIPSIINGKPGPIVPGLCLRRNSLLQTIVLGSGDEMWVSTGVERVGPDGVKATAFLRNSPAEGLDGPRPDASVAGTWERVDESGARRILSLNANGVVDGPRNTVWGVRDGAVVIDHGPFRSWGSHFVETLVLSEDGRALHGTLLNPAHWTKVD